MHRAGAVLGCEQFLKNYYWEMDLICREEGSLIAKYDWDSFMNLRETNTLTAIRFYNRVIRQLSYKAIYTANDFQYFSDRVNS